MENLTGIITFARAEKKQKHFLRLIFIAAAALCFVSTVPRIALCDSETVSSRQLIDNANQYNGKEIIYSGEVIGDVMARGNFAWINVSDANNAIGVWVAKDLAREISYTGSYKQKGDIVEIKGKFNRACVMHGGDLDIHAESLQIVKKGANVDEVVSPRKIKVAITFLIICLTLTVIYFIRLGIRSWK